MNSLPLADEFSEKLPRYSAAGFVDDPRGPRGTRFSFFDSMGRTRQRSIERDERSEACPGGNRVNLHAERISEGGKSRGGERERETLIPGRSRRRRKKLVATGYGRALLSRTVP